MFGNSAKKDLPKLRGLFIYILLQHTFKCDRVKILICHVVKFLPKRQSFAVLFSRTFLCVTRKACNGSEVTLCGTEYLPCRVFARRSCQLISAALAVNAFNKAVPDERRHDLLHVFF